MSPLIITITNNLRLKNVPPDILKILTAKLELINPKWLENEKMRRWNRDTPKELRFYDKVGSLGVMDSTRLHAAADFTVPAA